MALVVLVPDLSAVRCFGDPEKALPPLISELQLGIEAAQSFGRRQLALMPAGPTAINLAANLGAEIEECSIPRLVNAADSPGGVVLVVCCDEGKDAVLLALSRLPWRTFPDVVVAGMAHQLRAKAFADALASTLPIPSHATGYPLVKAHLADAVASLSRRGLRDGTVAEFGVYRGGTLLLLKRLLRSNGLENVGVVGFDTFSGFPPRGNLLDLYSDQRFRTRDRAESLERLRREGIRVVTGDIRETAKPVLARSRLLLSFFDTDNYSAVASVLPTCFESTVPGGFVVFDHFYTKRLYLNTIGERLAALEFFDGRPDVLHLTGTGVFFKLGQ